MKTTTLLPVAAALAAWTLPMLAQETTPDEKPRIGREERAGADERFARMKNEVAELRKAGKNEEAERLTQELERAWKKHHGGVEKHPKGEAMERFEHLQQAIKHLLAAGMKEQARNLEQAAREMREHLAREQHQKGDDQANQIQREMGELREQMQRLTREMQALREHIQRDRADKNQ